MKRLKLWLIYKFFPFESQGFPFNRHVLKTKLGKLEFTLTVKNLKQPSKYYDSEVIAMLNDFLGRDLLREEYAEILKWQKRDYYQIVSLKETPNA